MQEKTGLDTEKQKENALAASVAAAPAPQEDCPPAPARNKESANKLFNRLNYFGLGFLANSSLSLWITYNVMPTKWAQARIDDLRQGLMPVARVWDKTKGLVKGSQAKEINHALRQVHVAESARSMAEILCMCIAGCIVLVPMKLLEDHKKDIVDKIDRWQNPDYYKHCEKNNIKPDPLP